ncbi:class I SAM-dependent methyltransferase [Persicitalea jodogahamensis]|uniref:Methyltransferase type 11 domain-containing protein n=1 Tax=Persicitalea jodogahamensis TaxID=402147 RepID=A0A8J3G9E7_9BACT|nr:hypothetical protein GCM10007390_15910 [Persicitalea jodogahamensis]
MWSVVVSILFSNIAPNDISILDYGSSWGYQSFQFLKEGYNCSSYEISKQRAEFGNNKLRLNIQTDEQSLPEFNDIFFSSHVIEHVPSPSKMIKLGTKLLKENGYFIEISPNGS